jgi:hypothetical protein
VQSKEKVFRGEGVTGAMDVIESGAESEGARVQRRALYLGQAKEVLLTYGERLKDPRWKPVTYNGDKHIACYEFEDGPEDGYNLKAECIIEGKTADLIAKAHRNHQVIPRRTWDGKDIHDIRLLEEVRSQDLPNGVRFEVNVQVAEHNPGIPLVAIREFVYIEASLREPSTANPDDYKWTILTREAEHPERPIKDNPVRALSRTVMVLTPMVPKTADGINIPSTAVTLVAHNVHPGGNIPDGVIPLYKTKLADRLAFLKKTMFI